eukprot:116610-Rhodomonas_salina.1
MLLEPGSSIRAVSTGHSIAGVSGHWALYLEGQYRASRRLKQAVLDKAVGISIQRLGVGVW